MNNELTEQFKELARPLNDWLQQNFSPHHRIIITFDGAELLQGQMGVPFEIKD